MHESVCARATERERVALTLETPQWLKPTTSIILATTLGSTKRDICYTERSPPNMNLQHSRWEESLVCTLNAGGDMTKMLVRLKKVLILYRYVTHGFIKNHVHETGFEPGSPCLLSHQVAIHKVAQ